MDTAIIQNAATQHQSMVVVLGVVLLLPWLIRIRRDRRGWRFWELRGLLWSITITPHEITAELDGLRAIQRAMVGVLRKVWRLAQNNMIAVLWEWLKRWLGW